MLPLCEQYCNPLRHTELFLSVGLVAFRFELLP